MKRPFRSGPTTVLRGLPITRLSTTYWLGWSSKYPSVFSPSSVSSSGWSLTWWFLGGAENRELSQGTGLSATISEGASDRGMKQPWVFCRKGMVKRHWSLLFFGRGFHHLDISVRFNSSWYIWIKKNDHLWRCLVMSEQGIDMFSTKWGADKQLARSDLGLWVT